MTNDYDQELDLGDDESLPWLADDEPEVQTSDTGRLVGIALLGLAALALLGAGVWFVLTRTGGTGPEPDGSLIAAPEGPYRTAPEDAGGREFEGTGDTSFVVGEGQTREGRIADAPEPAALPTPSIDGNEPTPETRTALRYTAPPAGTAVQVGAYSNRTDALEGWETLRRQTEALQGVEYRIVEGQADIGRVHRLQAAVGSAAAARSLCDRLRADGLPCQVK